MSSPLLLLLADVAPDPVEQAMPLALLLGVLLAGVAMVVLLVTHNRRSKDPSPE